MELEERMAKIEGALEQMNLRLADLRDVMNHRIADLRWEVRIWFLLLVILMTLFRFIS